MTIHRTIGLTGGIACGKSTVSDYLSEHHRLFVLDADQLAREAVCPGSEILARIAQRYGPEILLANGQLNRSKLGDLIFQDIRERQWLESLIHPYVRDRLQAEQQRWLQANFTSGPAEPDTRSSATKLAIPPTLVMVVPLLFEARMESLVTEIWVVQCPEELQRSRLMQRNGLTLEQAQQRLDSQMPLSLKAEKADVLLDNSGSREFLWEQIDQALSN